MQLDEIKLEEARAEFERIVGAAVIEWWSCQQKPPETDMNALLQMVLKDVQQKRNWDNFTQSAPGKIAWERLQSHRLYKQGWFDVVIASM